MLIGRDILIVDKNIKGKVIDETKNTLLISTEKGIKRILKDKRKIIIYLKDKEIKVHGEDILMRPWEYAIR
ncbi:MAG: ribonuclease P protein subunit [Nanoarchaeota archaeon]|nr:ribonuclease P protein subunit [Nanoarchaeota archaeon]